MSAPREKVSVANMRAAWGEDAPEWIVVLAEACDDASQSVVAKRIGYSSAVVSYALRRKYPGDLSAIEQAVKAAYMAEQADCPVMGRITLSTCLESQSHAKNGNRGSAHRARMFRACRACPKSRIGGTHVQA